MEAGMRLQHKVSGTCCRAYLFAVLISLIIRHVDQFALEDTAERNDRFTAMILDPFKDLHAYKVTTRAAQMQLVLSE